jgi:hypothetical protein
MMTYQKFLYGAAAIIGVLVVWMLVSPSTKGKAEAYSKRLEKTSNGHQISLSCGAIGGGDITQKVFSAYNSGKPVLNMSAEELFGSFDQTEKGKNIKQAALTEPLMAQEYEYSKRDYQKNIEDTLPMAQTIARAFIKEGKVNAETARYISYIACVQEVCAKYGLKCD